MTYLDDWFVDWNSLELIFGLKVIEAISRDDRGPEVAGAISLK